MCPPPTATNIVQAELTGGASNNRFTIGDATEEPTANPTQQPTEYPSEEPTADPTGGLHSVLELDTYN